MTTHTSAIHPFFFIVKYLIAVPLSEHNRFFFAATHAAAANQYRVYVVMCHSAAINSLKYAGNENGTMSKMLNSQDEMLTFAGNRMPFAAESRRRTGDLLNANGVQPGTLKRVSRPEAIRKFSIHRGP